MMERDERNEKFQGKKPNFKGKRKGNNRSNNYRDKDKFEKSDSRGSNNPAWYATDASLLRDAASIPYSWAIGAPIYMGEPMPFGKKGSNLTVPGILSLNVTPTIGYADTATSPINIAALSTYTFIRHANSGHANYDAPDLMLYIMACGSVYSYINYLQRLYGIATLFSQRNRYMPDALLQVQAVDVKDMQNNLSNFRYGINLLVNKAASFAAPANMPIFNRMAFMYQNLYSEGESIKDQLYLFNPDNFWKFTWDVNNKGSLVLDHPEIDENGHYTVQALLDFGNTLVDAMRFDEDMNIMSGDILKAYGPNGIVKLASVPVDYTILPVYSQEVLEQIKNATVVGDLEPMTISQDATNSFLVSTPKVLAKIPTDVYQKTAEGIRVRLLNTNRVITTGSNDPTPESTMVNSRLIATGYDIFQEPIGPDLLYGVKIHCGSEVVTKATVGYFGYKGETEEWGFLVRQYDSFPMFYADASQAKIEDDTLAMIELVSLVQNFKYAPFMRLTTYKKGTSSPAVKLGTRFIYAFDIDNFAILDDQDVSKLHETALVNMLHVPSIAKIQR